MSLENEYFFVSKGRQPGTESSAHVRLRAFKIPPIRDAAVIGRLAPVTCEVMKKTLRLVSPEPFEEIAVRDETIASILVRQAILRKIGPEVVKNLVLRNIKPLMAKTEILALNLEIEVEVGESL